jgi:uncharacterized protein (TIGR03435 family)
MTARLGLTLLHFLWQGAAIAAIYAIARIRTHSAQARYILACIALAAMTIAPVITFTLSGQTETSQAKRAHVATVAHHSAPLAKDPALDPIPAVPTHSITNEIVPAWLIGAAALWLRLLFTWIVATRMKSRQTRAAPREWQQTLDRLGKRSVQLLISPLIQVPTVIGWLRPVVLIPVGALAGVPSEHVEALLAHELAHIRRHDYLVNILQSVAEATLFYHPAVWWISHNIREERENCCDDIAVAITGDPLAYAQALADLESHRPVHLTPALAANGGSLKHRIARLLGVTSHTSAGPGAIAAALILLFAAYAVFAQTSPPPAKFEAVSIKLNTSDDPSVYFGTDPGRLTVVKNPITNLIGNAYENHNLIGGPEWIRSDRYDVEATAAGSPNEKQMMQMLQVLLAERFNLKVHTEQREQLIYNLVVAKGGLKLHKRTDQNCTRKDDTRPDDIPSNPCGNNFTHIKGDHIEWTVTNSDMQHMVRALTGPSGQPVIDKTGITGTFDLDIEFASSRPGSEESTDPNVPSIFAALDQLGLKLEPAKGPVDFLVIDHIDRPTPN